jgi:hypothetical protein
MGKALLLEWLCSILLGDMRDSILKKLRGSFGFDDEYRFLRPLFSISQQTLPHL